MIHNRRTALFVNGGLPRDAPLLLGNVNNPTSGLIGDIGMKGVAGLNAYRQYGMEYKNY